MKKDFFTFFRYSWLLLVVLAMPYASSGQAAIACNDLVQLSLNDMCSGLTPEMLLEGETPSPAPDTYSVSLGGKSGAAVQVFDIFQSGGADINLTSLAGGGPIKYTLTTNSATVGNNTCWGSIIIEANIVPSINTPNIYETTASCSGEDFGKPSKAYTGTLVDGSPDIYIDPEWYGSVQMGPTRFDPLGGVSTSSTGYYGDIIDIATPKQCVTAGGSGAGLTLAVNASKTNLKWGQFLYNDVTWNASTAHFIVLTKNSAGKYVPNTAFGNDMTSTTGLAWNTKYKILVYAANNDAIGNYRLDLSWDETPCNGVSPTLVELDCGETPTTVWSNIGEGNGLVDRNGNGKAESIITSGWWPHYYFVAYMAAQGCGIDYDILPPSYENCGDICSSDGSQVIVKYEILVRQHGELKLVPMLRQGYTNKQVGTLPVCEPKYDVNMPCGSDPSPDGVYAYYLELYQDAKRSPVGGLPAELAAEMAYAEAYPHICTDEATTVKVTKIVTDHVVVENGTREEIVWNDLDGDGLQDVNEWEVITVVDKEIVERDVEKKVDYKVPHVIPLNEKYCGYTTSHDDITVPECGDGYKVIRHWNLVNWCTSEIIKLDGSDTRVSLDQKTDGAWYYNAVDAPAMGDMVVITDDAMTPWTGSGVISTLCTYPLTGSGSIPGEILSGPDAGKVAVYAGNGDASQRILVVDNVAPTIKLPYTEAKTDIQPWTCEAYLQLPTPTVADACGGDVTVKWTLWGAGSISSTGVFTGTIPDGGYSVATAHATDQCGNTASIDLTITSGDNTPPVPVCQDELVVSLTPDSGLTDGGIAKIPATSFDAGSHDAGCGPISKIKVIRMADYNPAIDNNDDLKKINKYIAGTKATCSPETLEVTVDGGKDKFGNDLPDGKIEYTLWADFVKYCCEDRNTTDLVIMRVWDAHDNFNDCMVSVSVQDKISLNMTCPPPATVKCTEYSPLDLYGTPSVAGLCDAGVPTHLDESDINTCGDGVVKRVWTIPASDQICVQSITVTGVEVFDPNTILWPIHHTGEVYVGENKEVNPATGDCGAISPYNVAMNPVLTCEDDIPLCTPSWTGVSCGLVGVSDPVDEYVYFDDEACVKIIRRWTVVDWCTWNPNDDSNFDDENDTDRDVFVACEDWCDQYDSCFDRVGDEGVGSVYFRYSEVDVDGYYTFDQVFKVTDTDAPEITCTATSTGIFAGCVGSISFSATGSDTGACPSASLTYAWTITNAAGGVVKTGTGDSGEMKDLTAGTYTVSYTVSDGCDNTGSTTCEVELKDEKAPTPYCYQSISTAVMAGETPSVEIWASDYLQKGEDNCTAEEDLIASFSGTEAVTNMAFGCDDVTGSDIELKVWLWDAAGNADYCFVTIRVDDNGHCGADGSSAMIAGNISTEYGDDVEKADVMLNSVHPEFPAMRITENDGHYAFGGTPLTYDYEISAERNDDYMNGVSTLDLVLIQKHILGLATLDSPYKVIAADINSDQKVTGADLVQLRQLILGVTSKLPANDSWRFVDGAQSFATNTTPWPFTEVIDVAGLATNMMAEDFVGVKIGDVNANAQANSLMSTEVRSNGTLKLNIADAAVKAGDVISVDVSADNFSEVYGYQLTMNHAGLTLKSVDAGALEITDANIGVREEVLTMSWNNTDGVSTSNVLFTLNFSADDAIQLSDAISINSRITTAEAYVGSELANNDIELTFTNGENTIVATEYDLYQNEPNPFRTYTDVSFTLPNSGQATISVVDVTGKVVRTVKDQFNKGLNTVRFTKADLGAANGILYYQLESGEFTATKKMIVIE